MMSFPDFAALASSAPLPPMTAEHASYISSCVIAVPPGQDHDSYAVSAACWIDIAKSLAYVGVQNTADAENIFHSMIVLLSLSAAALQHLEADEWQRIAEGAAT